MGNMHKDQHRNFVHIAPCVKFMNWHMMNALTWCVRIQANFRELFCTLTAALAQIPPRYAVLFL
jgi:hypothetical protein